MWVPAGKLTDDDHREGRWMLLWHGGLFQKRHGCSLGQSRHCGTPQQHKWGGLPDVSRAICWSKRISSPVLCPSTIPTFHWWIIWTGSNRSSCLPMLPLSHVCLDPVAIHHHQLTQERTHSRREKKAFYASCYCAFTHSYDTPLSVWGFRHVKTLHHNTTCPPDFFYTFTPPTSAHAPCPII